MFTAALLAFAAVAVTARLTEPPKTVYEADEISPQNGDYDKVNKIFPAHECFYKNKLVHYVKFRMYTPGTYPNTIMPGGANKVPIGRVAIATTTGDASGAVDSWPILEFHTMDGESYSDFVEVMWWTVGSAADTDDVKAWDEIEESALTASGLFVNMPVVPTGAKIGKPGAATATETAPIMPVQTWYKGQEVHTYVFEVSDAALATHFASTRPNGADDFAFGITVVDDLVSATRDVKVAPLWHLNQHWTGVTPGENSGGPNPNGMRNIIDDDRGDANYSPLWALLWMTKLPIGYAPDDARSSAVLTEANDFAQAATPMLVNCPDLGALGAEETVAAPKSQAVAADGTVELQGALIMEGGVMIKAMMGEKLLGSATTNGMGGYLVAFDAALLPAGKTTVACVRADSGATVAEFQVAIGGADALSTDGAMTADDDSLPAPGPDGSPAAHVHASLVSIVGVAIIAMI